MEREFGITNDLWSYKGDNTMEKKVIVYTCESGVELLLDGESFYVWSIECHQDDLTIIVSEEFCEYDEDGEVSHIVENSDAEVTKRGW